MIRKTICGLYAMSLLNLASVPLYAHEAWAEKVILIHFGEPGENKTDAYKPDQILNLAAIDHNGAEISVSGRPVGEASMVVHHDDKVSPSAVFFTMQLNPYIITGDDWKISTATAAAKAEKSWVGSYTVTSILDWHETLTKSRGRHIELVPLKNPFDLNAGETLPLRVYRNGKPAKGVSISLGENMSPVVSDKNGNIEVPIKAGHQVILGNIDEVKNGHTIGHMAVLSFSSR